MPNNKMFKEYMLIVEKISYGQFPNKKEIAEHLYDYGFDKCERTLQRRFENLRNEFGIEVVYNKRKNGYTIDQENSLCIDSFLRLLEIRNTADILAKTLSESKEALNFISFEKAGSLKGLKYLKKLLRAIKENRKIIIEYQSFDKDEAIIFNIEPYLLKEYQNRWYIIGVVDWLGELRTFGIDRIKDLKILDKKFHPDSKMNASERFDNIVGLIYTAGKIKKVELSFDPRQGKYIKTLPMHHSQEIIADNEEELRIMLYIIPNFEFKQQLLMHGDLVKVINPKSLIEEMKNTYQNAQYIQYSTEF